MYFWSLTFEKWAYWNPSIKFSSNHNRTCKLCHYSIFLSLLQFTKFSCKAGERVRLVIRINLCLLCTNNYKETVADSKQIYYHLTIIKDLLLLVIGKINGASCSNTWRLGLPVQTLVFFPSQTCGLFILITLHMLFRQLPGLKILCILQQVVS